MEQFRQLRRKQEDDELDGSVPEPEKLVSSEPPESSPEPAAKRPRVGARFAVKKKQGGGDGGDGGVGSPKASPAAASASASSAAPLMGGLGLGGYDSDSD